MMRKVYDGFWKAKKLTTVSDRYQSKIDAINAKHDAAMLEMQEAHKAEIADLNRQWDEEASAMEKSHKYDLEEQERIHKEHLRQVREKMNKEAEAYLNEVIERNRENRKKSVDSRHRTEGRNNVKRIIGELNKLLLSPDKKNHVPIQLQKAVASALDAINFDNVGATDHLESLKKEIMLLENANSKSAEHVLSLEKKLVQLNGAPSKQFWNVSNEFVAEKKLIDERETKLAGLYGELSDILNGINAEMGKHVSELRTAYAQIKNSADSETANIYDEQIDSLIENTVELVGSTPLKNMSIEELRAVYDMYKAVLTRVRNCNKSFLGGQAQRISDISSQVVSELKKKPELPKMQDPKLGAIKQFFWNNEKPIYAFERIGSETLTKLYKNLRNGEDTWARDIDDAKRYFQIAAKRFGYDSWDMEKTFEFEASSGKKFRLNISQIMSLYAYSRRPQAADHIRKGGIVIDESTKVSVKNKLGITRKFNISDSTAYNISDATLSEIIGTLTPEQKEFANAMQKYLSETMGNKGNEVSIRLYDIKLFGEENYWPLKSSHEFMQRAKEQNENPNNKLKNAGMTKNVVLHASNPIVLTGFMETWANHVNEMSMYHAMVLPMEDFYRVYNWKTVSDEINETESMQSIISNRVGKEAVSYIDQLLKDLNGGIRADSRETVAKTMISKFKKSAVFTSASVVVQQPTSIGRAFMYVEPKYFVGRSSSDKMKQKQTWEECKRYAPIAAIKEMGMFDTDMGRSTVDYITATEYEGIRDKIKAFVKDGDYRDDVLGWAPGKADEITWCAIWNACKLKVSSEQKITGDAMRQEAGKLFTEVITKTQVYDSVFSRSANMRSKSAMMGMLTSFMAEPTTTVNMLEDAARRLSKGDKSGAKRAIASVTVSIILNSLAVAFVYAARDDDDDKTFIEKYLSHAATSFLDDINPATMIPILRDIWSLMQGYSIEREDMSIISDVISAGNSLASLAFRADADMDDDEHAEYLRKGMKLGLKMVDGLFSLTGLPEKNIRRDVNAIINLFRKTNWLDSSANTVWNSVCSDVKDTLPILRNLPRDSKSDTLYKAYISGDPVFMERAERAYDTDKKLDTALKQCLRDNDPRIRLAAIAMVSGNKEERIRITKEIISENHFDQDIIIAAINMEANSMGEKTSNEYHRNHESIFTYEDFAKASAFKEADLHTIREDLIRVMVANGKKEYEVDGDFKNKAVSVIRDMYEEGIFTKKQAAASLVNAEFFNRDEANAKIGEWDFKTNYGFSWSEKNEAYINGEISASQLKQGLIAAGKSSDEAENTIEWLDFIKACPEAGQISSERVQDYNEYCKNTGVNKGDFWKVCQYYSSAKSDVDSDGNTVSGSKKKKVLDYINGLALSVRQKDSLYLALGYSESTLYKDAPWH